MLTWETDTEYKLHELKKVKDLGDGWEVQTAEGWLFNIPKGAWSDVPPKAGEIAQFYGKGIGSVVRGVVVGVRDYFYRTPAEEEARHRAWVEDNQRQQRERFEQNKAKMDERVAALPEVFRLRIERYRAANPDFRWKYEGYELFTCTEAVKIATALETAPAVEAFHKLTWEQQQEAVPGLSEGHSGNTFGAACYLARLYLVNPEEVALAPGAMSPLVGTADYEEKAG